jgi:predicted nicotinamide N-methyase
VIYFLLAVGFLIVLLFVVVYFKDVLPLVYQGAPWQPSEIEAIRKMLEMAEVKPGEQLFDLGSGDGRVLITAAGEFGAQATGIEINPFLVLYSRLRIWLNRLGGRVKVIRADMFKENLGTADVVVIFQREETNERLKNKLVKEMKKGARLVSYVWKMKDWEPEKSDSDAQIYIYRM